MRTSVPKLSKSKFTAGLQCLKRLWNQCYRPGERPEPDPATQAIFDTGHQVGEFARQLIPGGVLVDEDHMHHDQAIERTQRLMADEAVPAIYEAAFTFEDIRIRPDILERLPGGRWRMLEVKSSTEVKDIHRYDVAIQKYVLDGCGLAVDAVCLVHINNQYVYDGDDFKIDEFLTIENMDEAAAALDEEVIRFLVQQREVLQHREPPDIEPGRHCFDPYGCEWWEECRATKPEFWVFNIPRIRADVLSELERRGIEEISEVPHGLLNEKQRQVAECVRSGEIYVGPDLNAALDSVEYPIHYLDFETFMPAIPRYKGTRPYQTFPVQWSAHVLHEDGRLEHYEWLCDGDHDPRLECAETLIAVLGTSGSIVTYSSYEDTQLKGLVQFLPDLAEELQAIRERLWDLLPVIRNNIYDREFRGSFSLKAVVPVLVPDMSYDDLDVQEGAAAQVAYTDMIEVGTSPERKAELRRQLLEYCKQDTLAMVKLHERCTELAEQEDQAFL